ncbi:hypothetical protein PBI_JUDY_38 [Arthrobacter phage Judy]|uniref:Uncharacterized protein n=1 Tax=Arthrobacter phage Judy TaxID=2419958 RepID=A0A3G2KGL5_9CAUD|nr:hypothetical protein HOU50_gp38 [Arthrobacter phage Judy]AYN58108.1 hypothetical protein PBI_JUDY_38 [Arthrobacter phage Judy]
MASIMEFLEARIGEDEATLERTGPFPHSTHSWDVVGTYRPDCPDCIGVPSRERVLAECAAKRAIIAEHAGFVEAIDALSAALPGDLNQDPDAPWRTSTLRHIAAVYKDHPDYRQEWARG